MLGSGRAVPNRVRFKVPDHCPFCGVAGQTAVETTVIGDTLTVLWCCRACNNGWPVTPNDAAIPDQRHVPRERRMAERRNIHHQKK